MRKSTITAALIAIWTAGIIVTPVASLAAVITVFHGSGTETINTAKRPAGGVHVVKPVRAPKSTPAQADARPARHGTATNTIFVAGRTLWIRDAKGALAACSVWSSGTVGKDVIRCTNRFWSGR